MPRKVFTAGEVLAAADVNDFLMDQAVMTFASSAARGSAIGTAVEGMVTWLNDENALQVYDGTAWNGLAASGGNAIINGAFEINQRNATSTTASPGFVFDRWKQEFDGGTNTYSSEAFTPGAAPVAGYEAANFARVITSGQSTSGQYTQFIQLNEDVRTFAGQTVTLSFFAKAGSGTPEIAPEWRQTFGSGGSSAVFTPIGKVAITTSWARYSFTFAVPSVSGKTIGAGSFYGVNFWLSAGSDFNTRSSTLGLQSNTFDLWGVQLEAGPTANVFRRNANNLQGELAACQRYYQRNNATAAYTYLGATLTAHTTNAGIGLLDSKTPMRSAPTLIEYSSLGLTNDNSSVFSVNSASNISSKDSLQLAFAQSAAQMTTGRTYFLIANNDANAFIAFSAEL
jgi:hypothetical protein